MRSIMPLAAWSCSRNVMGQWSRSQWSIKSRALTYTRQWSTPLAKQLSKAIAATGPIPLATFMRMCLTSDQGYYTSRREGRDQFGRKGDFITSPEISQIFGELIGIWFVTEWMAQGRKDKGIEVIEIGPGRGTLIDDILRIIRNFKHMASSIEAIYLVETSPSLREAQKTLLCGDATMVENAIGFTSTSKYANLPVIWVENLRSVPSDPSNTPFIVAHEFFDALPIHAFQSISALEDQSSIPTPTGNPALKPGVVSPAANNPQWREIVVSPSPPRSTHGDLDPPKSESSNPALEFQLSLSKLATPHSLYLPEISSRYKALKAKVGSVIEISPESQAYAQEISRRIGGSSLAPRRPSGAAIILDYGPSDTVPTNSLRGIRDHQRVYPLSDPGFVDLSADVDFTALADAALAASPGVEVHGPVEQGPFLLRMGIEHRAEQLQAGSAADDEQRKRIEGAWKRLVDGGGMGKIYKAMAIIPEGGGNRLPIGFGGEVSPALA